jgi:hypothetical protein
VNRELSIAEEGGWRQFWDGWIICPPCIERRLASDKAYYSARGMSYKESWPVPPNYGAPIGEASAEYDDGCVSCGEKPPLELTWKTKVEAPQDS